MSKAASAHSQIEATARAMYDIIIAWCTKQFYQLELQAVEHSIKPNTSFNDDARHKVTPIANIQISSFQPAWYEVQRLTATLSLLHKVDSGNDLKLTTVIQHNYCKLITLSQSSLATVSKNHQVAVGENRRKRYLKVSLFQKKTSQHHHEWNRKTFWNRLGWRICINYPPGN